MPIGGPDYGIYTPSEYLYPISTPFDHAIRQGLISPMDGKGDIFWGDDFESGFGKWMAEGSHAENYAMITLERSRSGTQSARLSVPRVAGGWARISTTLELPTLAQLGCEIHFTIPLDTRYVHLFFDYNDGANRYRANITWWDFPRLNLEDEFLGPVILDVTLPLTEMASTFFYALKLVINPLTKKYVRLHIAGRDYDISANDLEKAVLVQPPSLYFEWDYLRVGAEATPSYVDDILLTTNEP